VSELKSVYNEFAQVELKSLELRLKYCQLLSHTFTQQFAPSKDEFLSWASERDILDFKGRLSSISSFMETGNIITYRRAREYISVYEIYCSLEPIIIYYPVTNWIQLIELDRNLGRENDKHDVLAVQEIWKAIHTKLGKNPSKAKIKGFFNQKQNAASPSSRPLSPSGSAEPLSPTKFPPTDGHNNNNNNKNNKNNNNNNNNNNTLTNTSTVTTTTMEDTSPENTKEQVDNMMTVSSYDSNLRIQEAVGALDMLATTAADYSVENDGKSDISSSASASSSKKRKQRHERNTNPLSKKRKVENGNSNSEWFSEDKVPYDDEIMDKCASENDDDDDDENGEDSVQLDSVSQGTIPQPFF
jgi:hypothetical protein